MRSYHACAGLCIALLGGAAAPAQTIIDQEHIDVGLDITFVQEGELWTVQPGPYVYYNPTGPFEYDLAQTILVANASTATFPDDPPFAGAYDDLFADLTKPVYHLDQNEVIDGAALGELYLGLALEELDPSQWTGNLTLQLVALDGPGDLIMFSYPFLFFIDSRNGISASDATTLFVGSHRHVNWVFTAPGDYTVTFRWTGTLASGGGVPINLQGQQVQANGAFRFFVESICPGDVNGDSATDLTDLQAVLFNFGCADCPRSQGDLTGDGFVDLADLSALLFDFGCGM